MDDLVTTSDVEDFSDSEEEADELHRSMQDFVVPDNLDEFEPPPDAMEVDEQWEQWKPTSEGGRHFKNVVDRIEMKVKAYDDHKFSVSS